MPPHGVGRSAPLKAAPGGEIRTGRGLGQLQVDAVDHVIQGLVDVSDGNSENPIALGLEPSSLAAIGFVLVKRTVHLDR